MVNTRYAKVCFFIPMIRLIGRSIMATAFSSRLKLARARSCLTQEQLARLANLPQQRISKIENTDQKSSPYIFKLAKALKVNPLWLAGEIGEDNLIIDSDSGLHKEYVSSSVTGVTARATVKAGKWAEALELPEEDQHQIPFDQKIFNEYPKEKVYALIVEGDSMDKEYKEGAYLYCVPIEIIGRKLTTGDHVIVERQHGGKYECTVKEIEFKQDKSVLLWPRSHNPDHQSPLIISDPTIANLSDHTVIRVTALVIGSFYKRPTQPEKKAS